MCFFCCPLSISGSIIRLAEAALLVIRDDNVMNLIERISYHYQINITNRILRPVILQIYLDDRTWSNIEIFTEKFETYRFSGYYLDELYRQLAACARFVDAARNSMDSIKSRLKTNPNAPDKIYRDMSANNFPNNIKHFAELLSGLYTLLLDIDKKKSGNNLPVYTQIKDLERVSGVLSGY